MNLYLYVAAVAATPVSELRGAIPLGLSLHLDPLAVTMLAIFANIAIIPIVFAALKISKLRILVFNILDKHLHKKINQNKARFELLSELALVIFVAIPLPGTGAYTGVLIAELLGLNRIRSGIAIALGVCMAGALVFLASVGVINLVV